MTWLGRNVSRSAIALAVVAAAVVLPSATAQADEIRDMQRYLDRLGMDAAWAITEGAGTTVAVLDDGVDASHPDFGDAVAAGIDLTGGGGDGTDFVGEHGTAMAGLIGARGRGGDGIRGIAPATTILPVIINDAATAAEGFRWAADQGVDVINFSNVLDDGDDPAVRDAIAYALSKDVVVVAGAGNGGGPGVFYPAAYGGVITVSALAEKDRLTDVSSYGPEVDLAAPGIVVGLLPEGRYGESEGGTSDATAITSGVVALVRAQFPDLDAANVVNRMITTGRDIGEPGQDDEFGFGIVDPVAALTADVPEVTENPLGSPDGDGGGTSEPPASEPPASEPPASQPPATSDPCPTSPQQSESGGPAGPAGALRLGTDCGAVGVSPGSSNNALGVAVAVGIAVILLIGIAVLMLRRRRPGQGPTGGWQAPPSGGGPAPGGWTPPGSSPPPAR